MRRELLRNGELRNVCGFDAVLGGSAVPTPRSYSHFLKNLIKHREEIEKIFNFNLHKINNQKIEDNNDYFLNCKKEVLALLSEDKK